ncbi:hypothetical protein OF83DRAFT_1148630 [Amylostereum chailletii]|nr:hypothetical protein OF83DRAFT_1148630 [Amylostereum chailletii]
MPNNSLYSSFLVYIAPFLMLPLSSQAAFLCFSMFLAKMYSNSLLASLNGRIALRASGAESHVTLSGMHPTVTEVCPFGFSIVSMPRLSSRRLKYMWPWCLTFRPFDTQVLSKRSQSLAQYVLLRSGIRISLTKSCSSSALPKAMILPHSPTM